MAKRLKGQTKHLPLPLVLRVFDAWTLGFQSEQTLKHCFGLCQWHLPDFVMQDILINHSLAEELRRVPIRSLETCVHKFWLHTSKTQGPSQRYNITVATVKKQRSSKGTNTYGKGTFPKPLQTFLCCTSSSSSSSTSSCRGSWTYSSGTRAVSACKPQTSCFWPKKWFLVCALMRRVSIGASARSGRSHSNSQ